MSLRVLGSGEGRWEVRGWEEVRGTHDLDVLEANEDEVLDCGVRRA